MRLIGKIAILIMWYKIDAQRVLIEAWPTFLRKSKIVNFLALIAGEIADINALFLQNRDQNIIRLTHNSQVCKLEKILNDRFDYLRRIKITDGLLKKAVYIFTEGEEQPEWLDPELVIYSLEEIEGNGVDFFVMIPLELKNYVIEISALTKKYKLASKRFNIIIDDTI